MLRVPIEQAEPGMRLALPIFHPERGQLLLSEGYALDALVIRRLAEMEVPEFWIAFPGSEQIRNFVSPSVLQQQSQLVSAIADMLEIVQRDAHAPLEYERYRKTLTGIIDAVTAEPLSAAYLLEPGGGAFSELRHATEVCLLSILLGFRLDSYLVDQRRRLVPRDARDVVSLGLGALLHDIGKSQIDPSVCQRYEATRDDSDLRYREHVAMGHKMLSGTMAPAAVGIVLHHHQHYDGTGFPAIDGAADDKLGLAGEDIHVFARIVCVANHFDRLRRAGDGTLKPRVRVLREMIATPLAKRFDPVVLMTLLSVVPAFAPGSLVTLSDGTRGIVIAWHPEAPCQPTIRTNTGGEETDLKTETPPRQIDLRAQPNLKVIEHAGEDVSGDSFLLRETPENTSKNAA